MSVNKNEKTAFLMTVNSAAQYLNLPISRIRYEVFKKRIPHIKFGRTVRLSKEDLDRWIADQKVQVSNDEA